MVPSILKENQSPSTVATDFATSAKEKTDGDEPIVPKDLTEAFSNVIDDVEKDLAAEVQNVLDDASVDTRTDKTANDTEEASLDASRSSAESVKSEASETKNLDVELNAAIQRALDHPDAEDDSTVDDRSVVSASLSVSSTKSAIQLRLEGRKRPAEPTMDSFTAKMEAANKRRQDFLKNLSGKVEKHMEKISSAKSTADEQKDAEVEALKKKHDQKLLDASRRKERILQSVAGNAGTELKKVSSVRSVVEEKKEAEVTALQKKHDEKLARAQERKEYFQQNRTTHIKNKLEKISSIEEKQEAEVTALKKKHDEKLASAAERKEYFLKSIAGKSEAQLEKITTARTAAEEQQEAEIQALKKKHDEKLASASERKEYFLKEIAGKSGAQLEKIASARTTAEEQQEAEIQALKKKHDEKLASASERKEYFLKEIAGKSGAQLEKIASARTTAEEQQEAEVQALKKKHDEKLARATERKEYFIKSIAGKSEAQFEKIASARTVSEEKKEADVLAIKKKHDEKLATAAKRKEELLQSNSGKVEAKLEKVSNAKSTAEEQRVAEVKKKHEERLSNATERKEQHLLSILGKVEAKLEKMNSARSLVEEKKDAEVKTILKKHDKKLSGAAERKQYFLNSKTSSFRSRMEKFVSAKVSPDSNDSDADTSALRNELDKKMQSASMRKQAHLNKKKSKASAYLATTLYRGKEAMKRKRQRPDDERSVQMEGLDELEDAGLMWLPDDMSVAESVHSTASTKSAVQIRLESYRRPSPSRERMESKLQAAHERRQKAIEATREKAGFKAKMAKVSVQMRSAEIAVKDMSERFSQKMLSATKRREEYMEDSIHGKSLQDKKKRQIAEKKKAEKAKKVSAMQDKLESKLLLALERKEKILNAKSAKAAGDVSISSKRGQAAIDKKEATVEQLKQKSIRKLASAKERRRGLRKLEKEKKEVIMLRREMARSMEQDTKMVSVQDMLKSKVEDKLQAAEERRARIAEDEKKKVEVRNKRRQAALEFARQRKAEAAQIEAWGGASKDETSSLQPVPEEQETLEEVAIETPPVDDIFRNKPKEDLVPDVGPEVEEASLDERKLMARQQLVDEIRLANEAKFNELDRIRREMKSVKRPELITRDSSSIMSFGTIESTEMMSFDEGEVSISGLSTVREEESEADRKKAKAALALAELDIKLSEIQLLQAMLLAEEASLSGAENFKTSEKSVQDLQEVRVNERVNKGNAGKGRFKLAPRNFLSQTMRRAREATIKASRTFEDIKRNVKAHDSNRKQSNLQTQHSIAA